MATKVLWFPHLVLVLLMTMVLPTSTCPTACSCSGTTVNCGGIGLVAVPTGIPTTTTELNLHLNHLITSLPGGVFDKLVSLTTLNLFYNQISFLPVGVFDKLVSLTTLDLGLNRISSLPGGVFDKLVSLTTLNLIHNQISSLPGGVFDKLVNLISLDLYGNPISSLPAGVFDKLVSLTSLQFGSNSLILEESLCALHYARNNVRTVGLEDSVQRSPAFQGLHLQCNRGSQLCFAQTPQHLFCPCNVTESGSSNATTTQVYNGTSCVTPVTCPGPVSISCSTTQLCTLNNSNLFCYCPPGRALKQNFCVPELPTTFPTISSRTATPSSIRIAWGVLTAAETNGIFFGYNLYFRQVGAGQYQSISTTMNLYTLNDLEPNKVFQFRISASNYIGEGPSSPIFSQATRPAIPSFTKLQTLSDTSIHLEWTTPEVSFNGSVVSPDEVYYQIRYYKEDESSNYRDVNVSGGGQSAYIVSNLTTNTDYTFLVRQIYENGIFGTFSNIYSAMTNSTQTSDPTPVSATPTATIVSSVAGGFVATVLIILLLYRYRKSRPVTVPPHLLSTLQSNAAYGASWMNSQLPPTEPLYEYIDGQQEDYGYADPYALNRLKESDGKVNDKEDPHYSTMQMTDLIKKSEDAQTTAETNDKTNVEELSVDQACRGSSATDNDQHPNNDMQPMAMNGTEDVQESSQPMLHRQAANSQSTQIIIQQWGSEPEGSDQVEAAGLGKAAPSGLCPAHLPAMNTSLETDQEINPEQSMEDDPQPALPSETKDISTSINSQQPSTGYGGDGKQRPTPSGLEHDYLDVKDGFPKTDQPTVPDQRMTQPQIPSATNSKSTSVTYQHTNTGEDGDDEQQTAGHEPTTGLSHDYLDVMDANQDPDHSTIRNHGLVEDDDAEANTTPTCQRHDYVDLIDDNQQPKATNS